MEKTFPTNGNAFPQPEPPETAESVARRGGLDRLSSFRVIYVALFAFLLLDVFTVRGVEWLLTRHFERVTEAASRVHDFSAPIAVQIQTAIDARVHGSRWVDPGGVRVTAVVLGRDGVTPIYLGGHIVPPPPGMRPEDIAREAERLLPASTSVQVSVPFNSILVAYAAVLVQVLFLYTRSVARREAEQLARAAAERDRAAERAAEIDAELESVRRRLLEVEPAERSHAEEIRALQGERAALLEKLSALAERESDLRRGAARATDLEQERQALEDLLEEASADLAAKNEELSDLQGRLSRVDKLAAKGGGRGRESEWLGRRLRTLYKNLEIDDRAIDDIAELGDESLKLRAEEALKRLSDEAENVAVRRKVGGLPPHLSIFELGFAGKGRIYYAKGRQRRFRVLVVGGKNSQKPDLEYLSRLPRDPA
jgi:hypothetical protein